MAVSRPPARRRSGLRLGLDIALAAAILGLLALVSMRVDRFSTRQVDGVATVNDGDSLTLRNERIRLLGIDAPEYDQTCRKDGAAYPCGRQARAALVGLIGGRPVSCGGWERDRYGRLLASCKAGETELNRAMVERGWAVAYGDFAEVETAARRRGAGLWAGEFDRPREWRTMHGSLAEAEHDFLGRIGNWLRALFGSPAA
jgi:endonuclease YncB( thermonuclease family)